MQPQIIGDWKSCIATWILPCESPFAFQFESRRNAEPVPVSSKKSGDIYRTDCLVLQATRLKAVRSKPARGTIRERLDTRMGSASGRIAELQMAWGPCSLLAAKRAFAASLTELQNCTVAGATSSWIRLRFDCQEIEPRASRMLAEDRGAEKLIIYLATEERAIRTKEMGDKEAVATAARELAGAPYSSGE